MSDRFDANATVLCAALGVTPDNEDVIADALRAESDRSARIADDVAAKYAARWDRDSNGYELTDAGARFAALEIAKRIRGGE